VDIGELTTSLDVKVGGILEEPALQVLLIDAVGTFNAYAPQQVDLTGTTFSRDLSSRESYLLVMLAYATYLRSLHLQSTMTAVVHTNVAGRTDLTNIPKHVKELRAEASDEILAAIAAISGQGSGVGIQVHELGATLRGGPYFGGWPMPYWYYR
jgi:hypothetical protein